MTNPRALAARMSNQKPVDPASIGGGTAGLGLSGIDIAGAMAMGGADEAGTLIVMAKWVQDRSAQAKAFYALYARVGDMAAKRRWKLPAGKEYLRRLTRLAIIEAIDPHCCPTCQGRKHVWPPGQAKAVTCRTCMGIGRREWTDSMRYRLLEVDKQTWRRVLADKYPPIQRIVDGAEQAGISALASGLDP